MCWHTWPIISLAITISVTIIIGGNVAPLWQEHGQYSTTSIEYLLQAGQKDINRLKVLLRRVTLFGL